jgi:hypothetical protein
VNEPADIPPKPIVLKTDTGLGYFDYNDIIFFRAEGHKVECLTIAEEAPFRVYHNLAELEKKYGDMYFRRCSRSVIVNSRHIKNLEIKTRKLFLDKEIELNVSEGFIKILKSYAETNNDEKKYTVRKQNFFRKLKIIINKTLKFFLFLVVITTIYQCESQERFYRPDLPEKLCVIGIIDVDDTTLRHISFEKSYQSEYQDELNDSLREFSFTISSSDKEVFSYECDSTVQNINDLRIPGNIEFNPGERYYLSAKEKDVEMITADVFTPEPPAQPRINSTTVLNTRLAEPAGCHEILDVRTVLINIAFEKKESLSYAILVKVWGVTLSSTGGPWPGYVDFKISNENTTGFMAELKGLHTYHYQCENLGQTIGRDPTFVYFFKGKKVLDSECQLTLSIQYRDGLCLYDAIKAIGIKVISIPEELYSFEKSLYTYGKISGDPFAEPIYINGNIKGGNGIFALCRSKELKITFSPWI